MSSLHLRNLSKRFDSVSAVADIDLDVREGEFLVVLGPSGCGKTTTLRCIAGIEEPTTGEVYFGERCVFSEDSAINVPPKERDVGLVFQNYALYPHLSVFKNVAFGLKMRKFPKTDIERKVREVISFVGLDGLEDRMPSELSGGQKQRVALARMVARQPSVLLFDEPLSNLDVKLRSFLRAELKDLHNKLGATSVFVTHDQEEAMILGDRIVVMDQGKIIQIGLPDEIYHSPRTATVARFTGRPKTNLITGQIDQDDKNTRFRPDGVTGVALDLGERLNLAPGQRMILHVRPEELDLADGEGPFSVYAVQPQGAETLVHLKYDEMRSDLLVRSTNDAAIELAYGQTIGLSVHRGNIYSLETELLITSFGLGAVATK